MNALDDAILELLREHPLIQTVRVVGFDETPMGKIELKIRCRFANGHQLQVWLHHEPAFQDYAYQLFTDRPLLRWDNSPHYPGVPTAPNHFHNELNEVAPSPLAGNPLKDLPIVLRAIETWLLDSLDAADATGRAD